MCARRALFTTQGKKKKTLSKIKPMQQEVAQSLKEAGKRRFAEQVRPSVCGEEQENKREQVE